MKNHHKKHISFISRILHSHRLKGMAALETHVPVKLRHFVHDRIILSRDIAENTYKGRGDVHGSKYRMHEAWVFVSMNHDVLEGIFGGQWDEFIDNLKEEG